MIIARAFGDGLRRVHAAPSVLFGVRASGSPRLFFSAVLFYFRGFAWVLGLAYGAGFLFKGGNK